MDWQSGVLNKWDRRVCSNYRRITPLSLTGKIYAKVLERRVRLVVDFEYWSNNVVFFLVAEHWISFLPF